MAAERSVHTKRAENLLAACRSPAEEPSRVIEEPSAGSSRRPYTRFARGVPVCAYSWASSIGVLRFQKLTASVHQERTTAALLPVWATRFKGGRPRTTKPGRLLMVSLRV